MDERTYGWTGKALRDFKSFEQKFERITFSGNVRVSSTPGAMSVYVPYPEIIRPSTPPPQIRRVQVTTLPDADAYPGVLLVKTWDGTTLGGTEFPIVTPVRRPAGTELEVYRPAGGTGSVYDGTTPVLWRSVLQPGDYTVDLVADGGTADSNPMDRTYKVRWPGETIDLATTQSPAYRPTAGRLDDATVGSARFTATGFDRLLLAHENPAAGDCGGE